MVEFIKSSGNVFADVGLPAPKQALAKAELARKISSIIKRRGITQASAARLMGADQPKVSAIVRGQLGDFSMGRLIGYLNALGRDVRIVVADRKATRMEGARTVVQI